MIASESGITHSLDGTPIGYSRMGSGPALVICHGALTDQRDWYLVAKQLANEFTVYVFDRRGRNASGDCPDHYSWQSEIADLDAMMRVAGDGASLVGHSFGASLSLGWALQTGFAGKLVLYEPPTSHVAQASDGHLQQLRNLIAENQLEHAYDVVAIKMLKVPRREVEVFRGLPMYHKQVSMVPLFAREVECIDNFKPSFEQCRALKCKVSFILGEISQRHPLRSSTAALVERIPGAVLMPLRNQGHMGHLADPEQLASLIKSLLLR
ncbi:MAG TPA: alpha/beta hydrolase, partial [Terriglobales bacterium]